MLGWVISKPWIWLAWLLSWSVWASTRTNPLPARQGLESTLLHPRQHPQSQLSCCHGQQRRMGSSPRAVEFQGQLYSAHTPGVSSPERGELSCWGGQCGAGPALWYTGLWTSVWTEVASQTTGIHMASSDDTVCGHQHRHQLSWLWWGHGHKQLLFR